MVRGNFYYKRLGESIISCRKKLKLSQYQVADKSKVDRSYLAEVEEGKANPSIKFLHRISKTLKVRVSSLIKEL
ncbi:MAG: helix-turn-helix transcriptional regulator [Patescibacteria group bacterium]|jgi:transcriptional regulator with XRE-family HTH domain